MGYVGVFSSLFILSQIFIGASVGDTFSNVAVARQGLPEMAISASYGGPLFTLLFGSAISCLIPAIHTYPTPYPSPLSMDSIISGAFLVFILLLSMGVVYGNSWVIPRKFGICLLFLYIIYDVVLVLASLQIIPNGQINK